MALAASLILGALPALAARPAKDSRYRGETSQKRRISARVTPDRRGPAARVQPGLQMLEGPDEDDALDL
jgi:hypothetical protein